MSIELNDLNEPFLDPEPQDPEPQDSGPDFAYYASLPVSQKFSVEYQGEQIVVDSANWRDSTRLKLQILASYSNFILFGLAEQTVGTIIPRLQNHYGIDDLQTGYIFLASTSGYFCMALLTETVHRLFGVRGVVLMGTGNMTLAYLVLSTKPPFPIFIMCYALSGIGFGSLDAGLNGWMGNLVDLNPLLGILHGCYGIGCMILPPLITHLIDRKDNPWAWNQYYLVLSCIAAACLIFFAVVFRLETPAKYQFSLILKKERRRAEIRATKGDLQYALDSAESSGSVEPELDPEDQPDSSEADSATLAESLRSKLVWFFSIIMFVYVGAEVAFGAWLVTFLLRIRHFSYKLASYMATSFWTGLTFGRIFLGFVTAHFFTSELAANWVYMLFSVLGHVLFCTLAFTPLVWPLFLIVFVTGLAVGPIFPTTIVASIDILPVRFHAAGVGFICAFGGGGGAAIPFFIGLIAETSDLGLHFFPFIVASLFLLLLVCWLIICMRYRGHQRRGQVG